MALWQRWQTLSRMLRPLDVELRRTGRPRAPAAAAAAAAAALHNEAEAARQQAEVMAREMGGPKASMEVFDRCVRFSESCLNLAGPWQLHVDCLWGLPEHGSQKQQQPQPPCPLISQNTNTPPETSSAPTATARPRCAPPTTRCWAWWRTDCWIAWRTAWPSFRRRWSSAAQVGFGLVCFGLAREQLALIAAWQGRTCAGDAARDRGCCSAPESEKSRRGLICCWQFSPAATASPRYFWTPTHMPDTHPSLRRWLCRWAA